MKRFREDCGMNNNLRTKGIDEITENVIANCTACNETGKAANIRNLLTPRNKDLSNSVAIDLAEWTDPKTNQQFILLNMIDDFSRFSVLTVVDLRNRYNHGEHCNWLVYAIWHVCKFLTQFGREIQQ